MSEIAAGAGDELDVAGEAIAIEPATLADLSPDERIAQLELALESLGAGLDAVNDRLSAVEQQLEARIRHLEARTRDASINADIVSLQGKVTGLEDQVGARQAPAIVDLTTRVEALEARA